MPSTSAPSAAFKDVIDVVNYDCVNIVCHVPNNFDPNLTNLTGMLYDKLMTRTVTACGNNPLVTPGDPSKSAILQLVNHECPTLVMPEGCMEDPCVPAEDITVITDWINAGAPQ
ncbi:MAG TPA: hypothetical protein VHM70_31710 [Polyangiaceae bacterium]|jgi:hypothetical protein|nr:hypothetical protein [Polyangiaceae bacterium]